MPPISTSHPNLEQLRQFGLGRLTAEEAQLVESHVADCDLCTETLQQIQSDTLVSLLRKQEPASELPQPTVEADTVSLAVGELQTTDAERAIGAIPAPLRGHPRYRVVRLLGRGGMGEVYLATHQHLDRPVALKVIKPGLLDDPATVQRFRQEMRAVARLAHPNIVQAHDADQAGNLHFLVMEFVEGQSLHDYLKEHGPLPAGEACGYAQQAALGLQHAFERGLTHRDVKPHNLMRTPAGQIKILDFGLARALNDREAVLAERGMVMGTADYMAPEQTRDAREVDIRADVYSLGCTLYHLLAGHPPHPDGTAKEKLEKHSTGKSTPLSKLRADLPDGLEATVARMLAVAPADRFQTPAEVAAALAVFSGDANRGSIADLRKEPHTPRQGSRWLRIAAVILALLPVGLVAGVVVYRIQTDKGDPVIQAQSDALTGTAREKEQGKDDLQAISPLPDKLGLFRKVPMLTNRDDLVTFSPDSRLTFAVMDAPGSWGAFRLVTETATGRHIRILGRSTEGFCGLIFFPDGRHLVTPMAKPGRSGYLFRRWDLATGQDQHLDKLADPGGWPCACNLSADGKRISFTAAWKSALVVEVETGKVLLRIEPSTPEKRVMVRSLFLRDGNLVASSVWEAAGEKAPWSRQVLQIDDLQTGKTERVDLPAIFRVNLGDTIFPAGKEAIGRWHFDDEDKVHVEYRRVPGGNVIRRGRALGKGKRFGGPYVSVNGRRAGVWCEDRRVRFYDLPSGYEVYQTAPIASISIAVLSDDGRIFAFMRDRQAELHRLPDPPTGDLEP